MSQLASFYLVTLKNEMLLNPHYLLTSFIKNLIKDPLTSVMWQVLWDSNVYLMCLVPAVLIPDAQFGAVVKECFTAGGLSPCQHSVIEWRQPSPVLIVRRCTQRQQDLQKKTAERPKPHLQALFSNAGCSMMWVMSFMSEQHYTKRAARTNKILRRFPISSPGIFMEFYIRTGKQRFREITQHLGLESITYSVGVCCKSLAAVSFLCGKIWTLSM